MNGQGASGRPPKYWLYCDPSWLQGPSTENWDRYGPIGGQLDTTTYPLGVYVNTDKALMNGPLEYYGLKTANQQYCTGAVQAFTFYDMSITICPSAWKASQDYSIAPVPKTSGNNMDWIGKYRTLGGYILHEMLHLVRKEGMLSR